MSMKIIVDVWGGPLSQEFLARFVEDIDAALSRAREELKGGFLVNLRAEPRADRYAAFDTRRAH